VGKYVECLYFPLTQNRSFDEKILLIIAIHSSWKIIF